MKPSFIRRLIGSRNLSRNQIGILLALVIGVTGQMIVFLVPDPPQLLASQIPMLTPEDWPGSRISMQLFMTSKSRSWEEMREFRQHIVIENRAENSHIDQIVAWYADPRETIAVWDTPNPQFLIGPLVASSNGEGKPISKLICTELLDDDTPRFCNYFAYWEHWYTRVDFWSQYPEDLPVSEIQTLAARIDQLLMSAPDEPCYGFLCTSTNEMPNRNQE